MLKTMQRPATTMQVAEFWHDAVCAPDCRCRGAHVQVIARSAAVVMRAPQPMRAALLHDAVCADAASRAVKGYGWGCSAPVEHAARLVQALAAQAGAL